MLYRTLLHVSFHKGTFVTNV